ncbi:DUF3073 family protein [Streptacidiphilus sp. PB12-B1b]|uniref:DUF3073 family protein n=1 Tax=Streptacidiphilus sp. PB12-B1b TaxID=2705012 RepID=UPI0015FA3D81|nr:DUF3073 family protein [Streptacidiphilus sp. PB12-B1b]QMU80651.1 DUF3073 family protein [Streptacidiphilus sp. PB12-B1b]
MGRGRARAKQAKIARELKYSAPTADFAALQKELSSSGPRVPAESFAQASDSSDDGGDSRDQGADRDY